MRTSDSTTGKNIVEYSSCCKKLVILAMITVSLLGSSERAHSSACDDLALLGIIAGIIAVGGSSPVWGPPVVGYFAGRGISRAIVRRVLYKETTFLEKNVDDDVKKRLGSSLNTVLDIGMSAVSVAYELEETADRVEKAVEDIKKVEKKEKHMDSKTLKLLLPTVQSFENLLLAFNCPQEKKEKLSANNVFAKIGKAIEILIKNKNNTEQETAKVCNYLTLAVDTLTNQREEIAKNSKDFVKAIKEMLDSPEGKRCIDNFVSKNKKLCEMFQERQTSIVNRDRDGLYDYAVYFDCYVKNINLILDALKEHADAKELLRLFIKLDNAYAAIRYDFLLPITIMTYISHCMNDQHEEGETLKNKKDEASKLTNYNEIKKKVLNYIEKMQKEKEEVDAENRRLIEAAANQNIN
jgi:hypothetical protein